MNAIFCLFAASITLGMVRVALYIAERFGIALGSAIGAIGHGLCSVLAWGIVAGIPICFLSLDAPLGAWAYAVAPLTALLHEAAGHLRRRARAGIVEA